MQPSTLVVTAGIVAVVDAVVFVPAARTFTGGSATLRKTLILATQWSPKSAIVTAPSAAEAAYLYRIWSFDPDASPMSTTGEKLKCVHPTGLAVVSLPADSMTKTPISPVVCVGHDTAADPMDASTVPAAMNDGVGIGYPMVALITETSPPMMIASVLSTIFPETAAVPC